MNPRALRITKLAIVLVLFGANAGSAAAYSLVVIRQGNGDFRHLHWPEGTLPVSFQLNDQTGPGLANVTDDSDPAGAVNRSLAKWPAVCGVRMTLGSTAVADAVVDGINVITFADTETNRQIFEMAGSAVGLTLGSFRGETITETDILFNPNLTFTTTVDSDEALENADMFDVEGVVTHELGHSIGLHHSGVESATMWAIATVGARSLDPDDIAGARTLYPVGELDGIRGTVRVNGAPAFGAHVVAVADSGPVFSALTLPDGTYRIDGLDGGSYAVYVEPLDGPHSSVQGGHCVRIGNLTGAGIYSGATLTTNFSASFFGSAQNPVRVSPAPGDGAPVVDFNLSAGSNTLNPTLIGPASVNGSSVSGRVDAVALDVDPGTDRFVGVAGPNVDQVDTITAVGDGVAVDPTSLLVHANAIMGCTEGPLGVAIFKVTVAPDASRGARSLLFFANGTVNPLSGALRVAGEPSTPVPTVTATATTTPENPPTPTPTLTPAPSSTSTPTPTATRTRTRGPTNTPLGPQPCVGDCNHDHAVDTSELVLGAQIILGRRAMDACPLLDRNNDHVGTIDELVQAVAASLYGCL